MNKHCVKEHIKLYICLLFKSHNASHHKSKKKKKSQKLFKIYYLLEKEQEGLIFFRPFHVVWLLNVCVYLFKCKTDILINRDFVK